MFEEQDYFRSRKVFEKKKISHEITLAQRPRRPRPRLRRCTRYDSDKLCQNRGLPKREIAGFMQFVEFNIYIPRANDM